MADRYKSGYISVTGRPNTGKSTIINRLIGERLNAVSPKPQTTRKNILGIYTSKNCQMIFIDTPGIHIPKTLLAKHMVKDAKASIKDADIVLFVADTSGITEEDMLAVKALKGCVFLAINKIDLIDKQRLLPLIEKCRSLYKFKEIIPISALKGSNMDILRLHLADALPEGPQYYPQSQLSDKQERFFISEIIRGHTLRAARHEIPHSAAVKIEEMKDRTERFSYIRAFIYVERESQKKILVGKNGAKIREIGVKSRKDIEKFLARKTYIDLRVKILKNWRRNPAMLKMLGY